MKRLLKSPPRPSSILTAITGSVCRRVAIVVFLAILSLEAIILLPVFSRLRDGFIETRSGEAMSLFQAAVDPTQYPSIDRLEEIGANLVRSTKVAGGTVISGAGEVRANFGTAPGLTWADARFSDNTARLYSDKGAFDIFIPPEETQIPYGVILRLDVRDDWNLIVEQLFDRALLSVFVALVLTIVTMLVVAREVVRPLATIRKTVDLALNAPEGASGWHTGIQRHDEIGMLARAVDQLLFLTSATITDELASSLAIIERFPHGVLVFSEQGHIISANVAALELFSEDSTASLLRRDRRSLFRFGGEAVDAAEFVARGKTLGNGEVVRGEEAFPCIVAGDSVKRPDGTVLRRFLVFVDMRDLVEEVRGEVKRREEAEAHSAQLTRDLRLLRRQFDACLILTEHAGSSARASAVTVLPNTLVVAWQERLKREGEPAVEVELGNVPPILGDPAESRKLFEIAFDVVRLRSSQRQPSLSMESVRVGDEQLIFTIRETSADGSVPEASPDTDVALFLGALGVLCRRQSGAFLRASGPEDANELTFQLKVDQASAVYAEASDSEAA